MFVRTRVRTLWARWHRHPSVAVFRHCKDTGVGPLQATRQEQLRNNVIELVLDMYVAQVRTPSPAFVRSGLHHRRERVGHDSVARQAGADGSYFDNPDSKIQSGPKDGESRGVPKDASAELDANNKEPEKIPDSQWYPGIVVYAITNVAFMKIFEYSMDVSDIRMTMGVLIAFYAVAYLLRFILRRVFEVDEKFPQFFWEGFPQRYKK